MVVLATAQNEIVGTPMNQGIDGSDGEFWDLASQCEFRSTRYLLRSF